MSRYRTSPPSSSVFDDDGDLSIVSSVGTSMGDLPTGAVSKPKGFYYRNWLGFFIMGTINNLAYVVVLSAAQSLAADFNQKNQLGLIPWANVSFGFVGRAVNTFLLESVPYRWRVLSNSLLFGLGLVGLSFAVRFNFWVSLAAIVIVGGSSSYGESVILGYTRLYPSELVGGWGSGTGMAGVFGSAFYLIMSGVANLSNQVIFFTLIPTALVYQLCYAFVLQRPVGGPRGDGSVAEAGHTDDEHKPLLSGHSSSSTLGFPVRDDEDDDFAASLDGMSTPPTAATTSSINTLPASTTAGEEDVVIVPTTLIATPNHYSSGAVSRTSGDSQSSVYNEVEYGDESGCQRYVRCVKVCWWVALQLGLVYFFEYVASTGSADKAENPDYKNSKHWAVRNSYAILSFCYQFGVLLSRSSLPLIRIKRIEVLTLLQAVNFVLWLLHDKYKFLPIWAQFALMVYVGLLGGASYVNVFYLLLNDESIRDEDREFVVNLSAIAINIGIVAACAFVLMMDHTFLKNS